MLLLVLGMSFVSLSVHPGVVLHGALASILAYANNTAQSGVVSSGVGRVLLVAGAGFEPATFKICRYSMKSNSYNFSNG